MHCFQATLNGINSVQKVLQNFRDRGINHDIVNGYYGILIETFDCDKTFYTCVEVTAGGRYEILDQVVFSVMCSSGPGCSKHR